MFQNEFTKEKLSKFLRLVLQHLDILKTIGEKDQQDDKGEIRKTCF